MKTLFSLLLTLFYFTVHAQPFEQPNNDHFHEAFEAKVEILSIDSLSFEYYQLWRFQFVNNREKYGKLIVPKLEEKKLELNSVVSLHLCDPKKFILVFGDDSSKTFEKGIVLNDDLTTKQDSMHFHGPPMLNATFYEDDGTVLLDFGNTAQERVFERCGE